ncbi:MAG TPA: PRD domain-containing protein [Candidatus Hungatella pullicola]|nr:PRD domain-containing protein [Candidatus Hungatella pullicola]
MYRVVKILNNNGVLAIDMEAGKEVIFLGNGAGFGKKTGQRFDHIDGASVYTAETRREQESALKVVNGMDPVFLEVTGKIIETAEQVFRQVNHDILLPLADHIALAVKRVREGKELPNPFTQDIQALFEQEYQVALKGREIIEKETGCKIPEDEVGYITLHIHSALSEENVEQSLIMARLVKKCVLNIEEGLGIQVPPHTLGYSRLVSHIRYMIMRTCKGEKVNLDLEDYARENFPKAYHLADRICRDMEKELGKQMAKEETGFLGIHIQRVYALAQGRE